jgi:hypothetical protein
MATKEQNIARLRELAVILGREVDETGTAADIEQRVKDGMKKLQNSRSLMRAPVRGRTDDVVTLSQPGGMVLNSLPENGSPEWRN